MAGSSKNTGSYSVPVFPVQFPSYTNVRGQRRINFDGNDLEVIHAGNRFNNKAQANVIFPEDQRSLLDNLWQSFLKRDNSWFVNTMNALTTYFARLRNTKRFQFYAVLRGDNPGVYRSYAEAMVTGVGKHRQPWYKGTATLPEAITLLKANGGDNFFISPDCHTNPDNSALECSSCNIIVQHFNTLKQRHDSLLLEKTQFNNTYIQLQQKIQTLELDISQWQTRYSNLVEKTRRQPQQPTAIGGKDAASPNLQVLGKDTSNPVKAGVLPKTSEKPTRSGERSASPDPPASGKDVSSPETPVRLGKTERKNKTLNKLKKKHMQNIIQKSATEALIALLSDNMPKNTMDCKEKEASSSLTKNSDKGKMPETHAISDTGSSTEED